MWHSFHENENENEVPGFVACDACYEDHLITRPLLADRFQAVPYAQAEHDAWACDMAILYTNRGYEEKAKEGDWEGFVVGTRARLGADRCDERAQGFTNGWQVCRAGPNDVAVCAACYLDNVAHFFF